MDNDNFNDNVLDNGVEYRLGEIKKGSAKCLNLVTGRSELGSSHLQQRESRPRQWSEISHGLDAGDLKSCAKNDLWVLLQPGEPLLLRSLWKGAAWQGMVDGR